MTREILLENHQTTSPRQQETKTSWEETIFDMFTLIGCPPICLYARSDWLKAIIHAAPIGLKNAGSLRFSVALLFWRGRGAFKLKGKKMNHHGGLHENGKLFRVRRINVYHAPVCYFTPDITSNER